MTNYDVMFFSLFVISVPNHCWYQGHQYSCGLSVSCVFSGNNPLDLCNGGMVWSCCVPGSGSGGGNGLRDDSYNGVSTIGITSLGLKCNQMYKEIKYKNHILWLWQLMHYNASRFCSASLMHLYQCFSTFQSFRHIYFT